MTKRTPVRGSFYAYWTSELARPDSPPVYLIRTGSEDTARHLVYLLTDACAGSHGSYGYTSRSLLSDAEALAAEEQAIRYMRHAVWCREWRDEVLAPYCRQFLAEVDRLPPLTDKAAAVYELLLALPAYRAMTGPQIVKALTTKGVPTDQSTLTTHILPQLVPYGLERVPRIGYRMPPDQRPTR